LRKINRREDLPAELTIETLALQGRTGQARTLPGTGRKKKYEYRRGIITPLGDIEASLWLSLIRDLIERSGERVLQEQLRQWIRTHHIRQTKQEVERYALELHSVRIFDQENWVDYIPFNRRYRPEILPSSTSKDQTVDP